MDDAVCRALKSFTKDYNSKCHVIDVKKRAIQQHYTQKKLYGYNVVDLLIKPIALICLIWNLVTSPPGRPSRQRDYHRLLVVPHFSSGIVERTKRERAWKSSHAGVSPFLAWGNFHASTSKRKHQSVIGRRINNCIDCSKSVHCSRWKNFVLYLLWKKRVDTISTRRNEKTTKIPKR